MGKSGRASRIRPVGPRPRLQRGRNRSLGTTTRLQGHMRGVPVASRLSSYSPNLCPSGYPAFILSEPHGSRRPSPALLPAASLPTRAGFVWPSRARCLYRGSCTSFTPLVNREAPCPSGMPESIACACVLVDTPTMARSSRRARLETSAQRSRYSLNLARRQDGIGDYTPAEGHSQNRRLRDSADLEPSPLVLVPDTK